MKIAIKNPAPIGKNQTKWGDYHFGNSLARALRERGVEVVQDYWPEWNVDHGEDVVLVLRGKRSYQPSGRRRKNILWVISHPATVTQDEMATFDLVCVGSATHHAMVSASSRIAAHVLRQCTDFGAFGLEGDEDIRRRRGIQFVANSRGIRRDIVSWAIEAGAPFRIIGRHWGAHGLKALVEREYVENDQLADCYGRARLSLNDHWVDMRHFGYINNRVFDCLAVGSPILSDSFSELREVCGDAILYARDPASFRDAIRFYHFRYPELHERTRALWAGIGHSYTFAARAQEIIDLVERMGVRNPSLRSIEAAGSDDCEFVLSLTWQKLSCEGGGAAQILHLFPNGRNTSALTSDDRVSYLSGGFGDGPWHVAISDDMKEVLNASFDMILLDDHVALADPQLLSKLMETIGRKLKDKGTCVLSAAVSERLRAGRLDPSSWIRSSGVQIFEEPEWQARGEAAATSCAAPPI